MATDANSPTLNVSNLQKAYGPTVALGGVSFTILPGEVHALLGENGAGKSTLVKILSGVVRPDSGSAELMGVKYAPDSILTARKEGVATAFQELSLLPNLTVAENLALPKLKKGALRLISRPDNEKHAADILDRYGLPLNPRKPVSQLTLADRQRLEIVRALSQSPKLLILDEPTAVLSSTDWLFDLIRAETEKGTSILYISHRLNEIRELCARGTVLRSGRSIATAELDKTGDAAIFEMMVGTNLASFSRERSVSNQTAEPRLQVADLHAGSVNGASFSVPVGGIVGVAGLDGQGQSDLFHALYGLTPIKSGEVRIDGKSVRPRSPAHALKAGIEISLLPEERKTQGIFPTLSVRHNVALGAMSKVSRFGVVSRTLGRSLVRDVAKRVDLADRYFNFQIGDLSGGNQQKALLARVLSTGARTLLLFDPTRGVDVGTKQAIYEAIHNYAAAGGAVLLYSSELSEIVQLCDQCLVVYDGRIVAHLEGDEIEERRIVAAATGHVDGKALRSAA
ncbi:sugar ABC transporter ATP-binding protein [Paraburkholderia sp. C35]|uniref:sugar ABC transporter ATP-binding protein n=1 Tax=Paraburkholderia sp. C35 TaxID=2126993 RepID=UPI000D69A8AD|nr:sugar ABC transporter ATP-binding protein [Paraburkholderia sp. C35]